MKRVFLDECILQLYTIGSLVKASKNKRNIKYGIKSVRLNETDNKNVKKLEKDFSYSGKTLLEKYEILESASHYLYRIGTKFLTSPLVVEKTLERIIEILKNYNINREIQKVIQENYIELYMRKYGRLYQFNNGKEKPLKLHLVELVSLSSEEAIIIYFGPKEIKEKKVRKNKKFEWATVPGIYLDPSDKIHINTAYYCGCDAFLTLDNKIIKENCKAHRFLPIISPQDVIEIIKKKEKVKVYAEEKCRSKISKNYEDKRF